MKAALLHTFYTPLDVVTHSVLEQKPEPATKTWHRSTSVQPKRIDINKYQSEVLSCRGLNN